MVDHRTGALSPWYTNHPDFGETHGSGPPNGGNSGGGAPKVMALDVMAPDVDVMAPDVAALDGFSSMSSVITRAVTELLALEETELTTVLDGSAAATEIRLGVIGNYVDIEERCSLSTAGLCPTVASPDASTDPATVIIPCSLSEAMVYLAPGDTKSVHQVDFADQLDVVPHKASAPMTAEDVPADEQAANQELDFW